MCDANSLVMRERRRGKFRQQQKEGQPAVEEAWEREAIQIVTQVIALTTRAGRLEVVLHEIVPSAVPQALLVTGHCVPALWQLSHVSQTLQPRAGQAPLVRRLMCEKILLPVPQFAMSVFST